MVLAAWLIDLETLAPALLAIDASAPYLSADERERAIGMPDRSRANRWMAARIALRWLLERRGGAVCRGQPFDYAAGGRPRLVNSGLIFSLSDTGSSLLVGLSGEGRIGVDIEAPRQLKVTPGRAALWVAAGSGLARCDALDAADDDAKTLAAWTRIEAFAKARGPTLASCLSDLGLIGRGGRISTVAEARRRAEAVAAAAGLTVHKLDVPAGLCASIALDSGEARRPPAVSIFDHATLDGL